MKDIYCHEAYAIAGNLVATYGRRKAAALAPDKHGVHTSTLPAFTAHMAGGVQPKRHGPKNLMPELIDSAQFKPSITQVQDAPAATTACNVYPVVAPVRTSLSSIQV